MTPELELQLYAKYPKLFRQKNLTIFQSPMAQGICVGNGWYCIIDELCRDIELYLTEVNKTNKAKLTVEIVQIKEKFGSLRFYIDGGDEYVHALISKAEQEASRTCVVCGAAAVENNEPENLWRSRTTCNTCKIGV